MRTGADGAASGAIVAAASRTSTRAQRQPKGAGGSGAGSRYTSRTRPTRFRTQ
jgi:hypothetical protein